MRTTLHYVLLAMLVVVLATSARAQTPTPADDETPIVVGDERMSAAAVLVATHGVSDVHSTGERLIRQTWMHREAAARGLVADGRQVEAAVDARRRAYGPDNFVQQLSQQNETLDQLRAEITGG